MGLECLICLNKLLPRENNTFSTNCGHIYHKACIENWHQLNETCPHCRKPNPLIFQIFMDLNETDSDTHDPQCKIQNEILLTSISDFKGQLEENNKKFDDLYAMIEEITISISTFEVNNNELRKENDDLQQLLKTKALQDTQRHLNSTTMNEMEAKENIPRLNSKMPLAEDNNINREQKTSRLVTLRFDDLNQKLIVE